MSQHGHRRRGATTALSRRTEIGTARRRWIPKHGRAPGSHSVFALVLLPCINNSTYVLYSATSQLATGPGRPPTLPAICCTMVATVVLSNPDRQPRRQRLRPGARRGHRRPPRGARGRAQRAGGTGGPPRAAAHPEGGAALRRSRKMMGWVEISKRNYIIIFHYDLYFNKNQCTIAISRSIPQTQGA